MSVNIKREAHLVNISHDLIYFDGESLLLSLCLLKSIGMLGSHYLGTIWIQFWIYCPALSALPAAVTSKDLEFRASLIWLHIRPLASLIPRYLWRGKTWISKALLRIPAMSSSCVCISCKQCTILYTIVKAGFAGPKVKTNMWLLKILLSAHFW